jgi:serine/threonine protein kinase
MINNSQAIKIINRRQLEKKNKGFQRSNSGNISVNNLLQDAMREIAILKKLSHKNIIHLKEIINNDDNGKIYLVLEFCSNGPLMKFKEDTMEFEINQNFQKENKKEFTEDEIKDILRDIILGLDYCKLYKLFLIFKCIPIILFTGISSQIIFFYHQGIHAK